MTCVVCGKEFEPTCGRQLTCSKACRAKRKAMKRYERIAFREKPVSVVPKEDTIVAIGYAERQKQRTLELVGRVQI